MTPDGGGPLRIVTINTGKGDGPYGARLDALLAGLGALDADIILLQEAFEAVEDPAERELSTPQFLATGLRMQSAFHAIRRKPREVEGATVDSYSGLATLSRWPLSEVTPRALSDDADDGDRAVLFAAVETPLGIIRTANTHLTHLRHRDDLRVQQIREILGDAWWEGGASLRVLGGDLNARPDHEVHRVIRDGGVGWAGLDTYEVAGDPARDATIRHETPGGTIEARIDYLHLLSAPAEDHEHGAVASGVRAARVVLDRPLGNVLPSDHFGVLIEVHLNRA